MELQSRVEDLRKKGIGLAAISYDSRATLAEFAERRKITFPLLSDVGSAIIKQWGLLNRDVKETDSTFGIPHPGTFILNRQGDVASRVFEEAYQERSTVASQLVKTDGRSLTTPKRIMSPQIDILISQSDEVLAPGNRFTLVLEFRPRRNIHVYAPSVTDYKPLSITIDPQPFLRIHPIKWPPSEEYHFVPLDERVQVYQKPFTVVQDVTLLATQQAQAGLRDLKEIKIAGTIEYQACDDKICFNPASVPVTWTFQLKPLDRERRPSAPPK